MSASGSCLSTSQRPYAKFVVHCRDRFHYDVYIGRGSLWGNPFTHLLLANTKAMFSVESREEALLEYRAWLMKQPELVDRAKRELRGKILGCYCAPKACHGEILAEIANGEL